MKEVMKQYSGQIPQDLKKKKQIMGTHNHVISQVTIKNLQIHHMTSYIERLMAQGGQSGQSV